MMQCRVSSGDSAFSSVHWSADGNLSSDLSQTQFLWVCLYNLKTWSTRIFAISEVVENLLRATKLVAFENLSMIKRKMVLPLQAGRRVMKSKEMCDYRR